MHLTRNLVDDGLRQSRLDGGDLELANVHGTQALFLHLAWIQCLRDDLFAVGLQRKVRHHISRDSYRAVEAYGEKTVIWCERYIEKCSCEVLIVGT